MSIFDGHFMVGAVAGAALLVVSFAIVASHIVKDIRRP